MMKKTLFSLIACVAFLCGCSDGGKTPSGKESGGEGNDGVTHAHAFSSEWSNDDAYHWHAATCGHDLVKDKSSHTFGKWTVDTQPTETSEGERHRSCSVCFYSEKETMPKVEHVHTWGETTYSWGLDYSTCTASHSCTINLYHVEEETANTSYEVIYEPTTSSTGRGRYTAKFENPNFATQTKYVTIPKLNVPVTGISLSKTSVEVSKGSYTYLYASVTPYNASNTSVLWSSSNESVATVVGGTVNGVGEGTATITATTEDGGFSATCEVTVTYIPVTGVSLSDENLTLEIGEESSTVYAHVSPSGASIDDVTWAIEDKSVASFETTLFGGAKVKALAVGETTLKATTEDGGFTASCKIKVIDKKNLSYAIGDPIVKLYQYNSKNYIRVDVPITNTGNINIDIYDNGIDVEDGEGNLKQSFDSYCTTCNPDLIRPGETTYMSLDSEYTGDTLTGLVCLPHVTVKDASSASAIRYDVGEITFSDNVYSNGFRANGSITNNNEKTSGTIYVSIQIFDKTDAYYATLTAAIINDVEPGASDTFSASVLGSYRWGDNFKAADIGSYKAYACEWELVI